MEKNNGRQVKPVGDLKQLFEENERLKNMNEQLYNRCAQLENTWALNRANFLFKVLDTKDFSEECKKKAAEELEAFLFPKQPEVQEVKEEESK